MKKKLFLATALTAAFGLASTVQAMEKMSQGKKPEASEKAETTGKKHHHKHHHAKGKSDCKGKGKSDCKGKGKSDCKGKASCEGKGNHSSNDSK